MYDLDTPIVKFLAKQLTLNKRITTFVKPTRHDCSRIQLSK